jgi:integrase/recombinase XerD
MGKGRRERVLPLWKETAHVLKAWLAIRPRDGDCELFLNVVVRAMTRSGFEYILAKHVAAAASKQPSIVKKRVTPHVLRHTRSGSAMPAFRALRSTCAQTRQRSSKLSYGHAHRRGRSKNYAE